VSSYGIRTAGRERQRATRGRWPGALRCKIFFRENDARRRRKAPLALDAARRSLAAVRQARAEVFARSTDARLTSLKALSLDRLGSTPRARIVAASDRCRSGRKSLRDRQRRRQCEMREPQPICRTYVRPKHRPKWPRSRYAIERIEKCKGRSTAVSWDRIVERQGHRSPPEGPLHADGWRTCGCDPRRPCCKNCRIRGALSRTRGTG